ncbi:immunity 26/phosphotriesterase HocA family protein [Chryseobacterium sp. MEBOG06]|uniref:Imm26 family immunity protein n=1 Tax=Chryseobacterium sp. MEBOG06 TaxID=2879938 RepID=UPI001F28D389|nr:Imm26 family immunity protein [Chryseobacterium sp. MEBOG06]UKB82742.1 immunity 26/phosphotriesterase HocA family protein [Chryseobacterium sp. MEBOG06]
MAKRFKLNEGDVFAIPLGNSEFGLGQIINFPKTSDAFIVVIFNEKIAELNEFDKINIDDLKIIFLGYTFDAKLYYKDWQIIGNYKDNIQSIPLPFFKLGTSDDARLVDYKSKVLKHLDESQFDELVYKSEIAPIRYENALKAHFGLQEWIPEDYDKILYEKTLESVKIAEEILES